MLEMTSSNLVTSPRTMLTLSPSEASVGAFGIDVHADHALAAGDQQRNDADADEAGAAEDEYGHVVSPLLRVAPAWAAGSADLWVGARGAG